MPVTTATNPSLKHNHALTAAVSPVVLAADGDEK